MGFFWPGFGSGPIADAALLGSAMIKPDYFWFITSSNFIDGTPGGRVGKLQNLDSNFATPIPTMPVGSEQGANEERAP